MERLRLPIISGSRPFIEGTGQAKTWTGISLQAPFSSKLPDGTLLAAPGGMRTLLRHALTGQYYQSAGKWTTNPRQAHNFGFIDEAMSFVRQTKCRNMEIDLSFDNPRHAASVRLIDCF